MGITIYLLTGMILQVVFGIWDTCQPFWNTLKINYIRKDTDTILTKKDQ